jgi:hypothetical protein
MTEPVHEPETFLARVDVGVIVTCVLPAAQLYQHPGYECYYNDSDYYYPNNHRQCGWRVNNMGIPVLLPAMYVFSQKQASTCYPFLHF